MPILAKVASENNAKVNTFGRDYDNRDGTCERDYIYVLNLADAHITAVNFEMSNGKTEIFNVGTGNGVTVKEANKTIIYY